jgi:small subunit ribosomal protein S6
MPPAEMSSTAATYDLMLLLDPQAEETRRAKLVSDASSAIAEHGELLRHDIWGERQMAYHIGRKASAEYHLMQFHASGPELLGSLDRSLRIADEVLRFRLIKLRPGVPEAPDAPPPPATPRRTANGAEARAQPREAPPPEQASEQSVGESSGEPQAQVAEGETSAAGD